MPIVEIAIEPVAHNFFMGEEAGELCGKSWLSQFRQFQDMTQLLFTSASINLVEKVYFCIFFYNQHLMRYDFVQDYILI
jgi:hypothetical protein